MNRVGISAPALGWSHEAKCKFAIFYCVMIRKDVFDKIGMLDEAFQEGAGEDTDFCRRAIDAGFEQAEVGLPKVWDGGGMYIGNFPLYHKGEATVHQLENWPEKFERNRKLLEDRYKDRPLKLNLGSGIYVLPGYVNIDADPGADYQGDVRKLRYADNSVDEVSSYHLFEHFSPYEVLDILKEWYRVLKPGCKLCMELPDIAELCNRYASSTREERFVILAGIYGALPNIKVPHLYGWDRPNLAEVLSAAGFVNIVFGPQKIWHQGYNMRVECQKKA